MSIEKALADLTVALIANTAALTASAGSAKSTRAPAAPAAPAATSAPAAPAAAASTKTRAEMTAALGEVKEKKGTEAAKAIIKDVGGSAKMADIPDAKIDAVYNAAKAAVTDGAGDDDM